MRPFDRCPRSLVMPCSFWMWACVRHGRHVHLECYPSRGLRRPAAKRALVTEISGDAMHRKQGDVLVQV